MGLSSVVRKKTKEERLRIVEPGPKMEERKGKGSRGQGFHRTTIPHTHTHTHTHLVHALLEHFLHLFVQPLPCRLLVQGPRAKHLHIGRNEGPLLSASILTTLREALNALIHSWWRRI